MHRLGALCEIFDGPHATPKLTEDGPVFLGIQSLSNGRLDLLSTKHVSETDFERWTRRVQPRTGDLVFSYETRLGEAALIPQGLRCCLGRRMGLLRRREGVPVVPEALLYAYLGDQFQAEIRKNTIFGSTVDRIPISRMHDFKIALPPLPEQRAIAEVLGALDDKIESNAQVAGDQLSVARTWFEHLASEAARERLGSMIALIRSTVHPGASPDDAFEHFSIPAFDQGSTPTLDYGRDVKSGKTGLPGCTVSVLLSKLNPDHAWRCWWAVPSGVGQAVCSPEFVAMAAKGVPPEWLFAAIAWDSGFRRDVLSGLSGTTGSRQRVKPSDVAAAEAPVFEHSIAEEWLAFARPAFARIERCRVESRRLAAIRDALLPRLVSGRIRVPVTNDLDEAVETVLDAA
jgi:type I restriction enzyme S subunit